MTLISPSPKQINMCILITDGSGSIPIDIAFTNGMPDISITIILFTSVTHCTLLVFPTDHVNTVVNSTDTEIKLLDQHGLLLLELERSQVETIEFSPRVVLWLLSA